jgi:hypothetical protein
MDRNLSSALNVILTYSVLQHTLHHKTHHGTDATLGTFVLAFGGGVMFNVVNTMFGIELCNLNSSNQLPDYASTKRGASRHPDPIPHGGRRCCVYAAKGRGGPRDCIL